ncbi:MAG: MoaD/ThiS family protein [Candidatus Caldarchaeum sp.]|nr:MoaD/ThiS family protein [Candidatus Caldarchaeum sp.]
MKVELMGPLRSATGRNYVEIQVGEKMKLSDLLGELDEEVRRFVVDDSGKPHPGILVLVNGVDVRFLSWLETEVGENDVVTLIPSIHGG